MLILKCILGLQIQSIDFTNPFAQVYIPSGEPVFIELPRDFKSDWGQQETWLDNQEIQGIILCKKGYPEEIIS